MPIIDFHVHAFKEKVAKKAISQLAAAAQKQPATDGTLEDTISKMKEWGTDYFVLQPIATRPDQQRSINDWVAEKQGGSTFCCGSIHPEAEDALSELERIKALGLRGIKLHSDYQNFRPNEKRMFPIYEKLIELSLPVLFHAGYDPITVGYPLATPQSFAEIAKLFPELTIVAAHLGSDRMFDDTEKYTVGLPNVYFDTSLSMVCCQKEQFLRIVNNHGADKILFATDCPWGYPPAEFAYVNDDSLTKEQKDLIFYKNAARLLGVCENDL